MVLSTVDIGQYSAIVCSYIIEDSLGFKKRPSSAKTQHFYKRVSRAQADAFDPWASISYGPQDLWKKQSRSLQCGNIHGT